MIKRVDRKLVYKGSILDVYSDTMELEDGRREQWDMVHHRMAASCTVAVTPEGDIILVRQQRPALDRETIELPAGCRDSVDEDFMVCAERELREETGYTSEKWSHLLSLRSTVAFCDERIEVFLAEDVKRSTEQVLDPAEDIRIEKYELGQALDMIYSGKLQDGKTVAGILAYATRRQGKGEL